MSYIPTTEKLAALGYNIQPDRNGFGRQEYRWSRRCITTFKDATHVIFMEHMGLDPNPKTIFSAVLPSEDFFDQLLLAIDWR
jgi:hypothetical protein